MVERDDRVARIQARWRVERPDLDVAPQGVIARLHRLAGHLTDELVAVYRQHGLGEGDFDVLATLRRSGPPYGLTPLEIAEQTMVTTGGMTKRIDRLEAAGLVTRRPSDRDGRSRVVTLTPEGTRVIDDAFTDHMANERRLVDQLTPRQQEQLEGLLATWLAVYEPAVPDPDDGAEPTSRAKPRQRQ
jgi:DNA-binding MarR family transcriptional regulator